ncbi:MAG: hypothetical protein MK041_10390, partial [Aquabacterium sp.]|nr:hypothetical protein [Aquabacterium sp.]
MSAPLIPQEIYLLERYSSLEYFGELRDYFAACVKAAEDALAEFMRHLPPDYRAQPLHMQPDIVWGERVIPNMQWALKGLIDGYIDLSHGDWDALGMAGNVTTTFVSISRDYSSDWMPEPFERQFDQAWLEASKRASNINITSMSQWTAGDLSHDYARERGPLDPPSSWPVYRLNPQVRVKTDEKVPRNGVYLPDLPGACAQIQIEGYTATQAGIPDPHEDPRYTSAATLDFDTTWTLVERVADSGGGIPGAT